MTMRERIVEKANELFTKHGIKRITMDEIATQSGISKKTIYQSFADKNELISEIFDKHICISQENCLSDSRKAENAVHEVMIGSETFCLTMQSINRNLLYDLEKYHPDIYKRFTEFKNHFLYTLIIHNLKRGIEENVYRKDLNIEIIARMRIANILLSMNMELFPGHQFKFPEVEHEIINHFLNGIVTPKGAAMIKTYAVASTATEHVLN